MDREELLKLAGRYFISDTGQNVANLIRKIQIVEGHADCFSTGKQDCQQMTCRWRKDCLPESAGNEPTAVPNEKSAKPQSEHNNKRSEKTL